MGQVSKQDSNITGLAYAEEARLGVLPGEDGESGSPVWKRLEPSSYNDFGGEVVKVVPETINPSRQRRKGSSVDLNVAGGFNHYKTFGNLTDLMQGLFFADIREKGREEPSAVTSTEYTVTSSEDFLAGSIIKGEGFSNSANNSMKVVTSVTSTTVVASGLVAEASPPSGAVINVVGFQAAEGDINVDIASDFAALTSTTLDFTTLGLVPGQWIFIGGDLTANRFSSSANNGFKRVRSVSANRLVLDKSDQAMTSETAAAITLQFFFGDVLRNETGSLIKRRSYNIERTLGAPDDSAPSEIQSEVLIGAVPSEFTLNVPTSELLNADFTFMAIENEQREGSVGPKQSSVQRISRAKEINTSSDVGRIRLSTVSETNEAPTALFAFITEMTLNINNNLTANKAVGVFGAFEMTAGTFTVSGNITAYFADVAAVKQVRDNGDVTLDVAFIKDNQGFVIDAPLISLGDGRLNVEMDQAITLPLTTDAATAEDIDENLDHTLLITYFNYLPDAA